MKQKYTGAQINVGDLISYLTHEVVDHKLETVRREVIIGKPYPFFIEKIILRSDSELVDTVCIMCTDKKNVLDIFRLLTVRTNGEDVLMVIGGR